MQSGYIDNCILQTLQKYLLYMERLPVLGDEETVLFCETQESVY